MAVALVHFSGGMPRQFHTHFLRYPLVGQNRTEGVPQGVESSAGKISGSFPLHDLLPRFLLLVTDHRIVRIDVVPGQSNAIPQTGFRQRAHQA